MLNDVTLESKRLWQAALERKTSKLLKRNVNNPFSGGKDWH